MRKTIDWRAVCGRTACTVRRAGRARALPDPYQGSICKHPAGRPAGGLEGAVSSPQVAGKFLVGRKTIQTRLTSKLHEVKVELRARMHDPIPEQGKWLRAVVSGYSNYHAVPGNWHAVGAFRTQVARTWYRSLRRRSQKTRLNWGRMNRLVDRWLPPARILHPWPEERFFAKHPR